MTRCTVVKALDETAREASAPNLARIRDILVGTHFKAYDERLQRHEDALEKTRAELRQRLAALETDTESLTHTARMEKREFEKAVQARFKALEEGAARLQHEFRTAVVEARKEVEATVRTLTDHLAATVTEATARAESAVAAIRETQEASQRESAGALKEEIADVSTRLTSELHRRTDEIAARLEDLSTHTSDACATLQQTKLSRYALGEVLLALGAQLLDAPRKTRGAAARAMDKPSDAAAAAPPDA